MRQQNISERMSGPRVFIDSGHPFSSTSIAAGGAVQCPFISIEVSDIMFSTRSSSGGMRLVFSIAAALIVPSAVAAQTSVSHHRQIDMIGNWQGTLEFPGDGTHPGLKVRIVLKIDKTPDGRLTALNYSIDQGAEPMKTADVTLTAATFKYSIPSLNGRYEGQVSADGNSIVGNWIQGSQLPLVFVRAATVAAAWPVPTPPPPPKPMAENADPSFEVATIKPSVADANGKYFRVYGRRFLTHDTSLDDLIAVAYGLHRKQIVGAPAWANSDTFDLTGVPAGDGEPNGKQWLTMVQKLLTDRFRLTFHHEQREISAYVLSTSKGGPRNLTKSDRANPLPSMEFRAVAGGVLLPAKNATIEQFAQMMQQAVLDRPVVDRTGLSGTFNFELTFSPDSSQFNGHSPSMPLGADGISPLPDLYEAMQQQLGLKLVVEKIPVDVLVIDHVEMPSEN
jgi:uncharacterized protein (TIGR03435 family)